MVLQAWLEIAPKGLVRRLFRVTLDREVGYAHGSIDDVIPERLGYASLEREGPGHLADSPDGPLGYPVLVVIVTARVRGSMGAGSIRRYGLRF